MNRVIVIEFVTLDGVVEDPDGSGGTPWGGWAFRHGPEAVAGDKFQLGDALATGGLLLGRRTWQLFSRLWPTRTDPFSARMNAAPKWVASTTPTDLDAWRGSAPLGGELASEVPRLRRERDVIVAGSTSVVHALLRLDLVDEIRLLVFPTVVGAGQRLFVDPAGTAGLRLVSAAPNGAAALLTYEKARG